MTGTKVSQFDAAREFAADADELLEAARGVLESGAYIGGEQVLAFEAEIAAEVGVGFARGVASGTDALWLALAAAGIGPGDLVIVPTFTFFATASAVVKAGATPVLVDIDPVTFTIAVDQARSIVEGRSPLHARLGIDPTRVRAIVPVHLYGQAADMDAVMAIAADHNLIVIEDAAQAFGARSNDRPVGGIGDLGAHSFFPTKNLGGFGDGGMVTTNDETYAARVKLLREHGAAERYRHVALGANSRLDALQAAMLRIRLRRLSDLIGARRRHAAEYVRTLIGVIPPVEAPGRFHTYNQFVVRVPDGGRDHVRAALTDEGVGTAVYYPVPLHRQEALRDLGYQAGDLPVSELACDEVLALPISPTLRDDERDFVVAAVARATGS